MATISGDITGLHWLNPRETPLDALLKGAQTGTDIARAMAQRQALAMKAAELPFALQAIDTQNKIGEANLKEQWLRNGALSTEREAWMQDLGNPDVQRFLTETDPNAVATAAVPRAESAKMQLELANRQRQAAQNQRVITQQKQYAEREAIAAKIIGSGLGLTPTPIKDAYGAMTYSPEELARLSALVEEQEQIDKLTLEEKKNEGRMALEKERSASREKIAGVQKQRPVVDAVTDRQRETWIANRAAKLIKEGEGKVSREEAFRQARAERQIASGDQYLSSAERRAAEAPAAVPQAAYAVGEIYPSKAGPRKYLGGPPTSPSSWAIP